MAEQRQWRLGTQLALIALPFAALTLVAIVLTLWVSWQLDGGAAAVNEAGRLRMQAYRLSLSIATGDAPTVARKVEAFDEGLAVLRRGDPERPPFMPWDDTVRTRFASVERDWARFRVLGSGDPGEGARLRTQTAEFSAHIDALVDSIEVHMARWTAFMHLLQSSVLALVIAGGATLLAAAGETPSADALRQRACTELLRQAAQQAGLLAADDPPPRDGATSEAASAAIEALLERAIVLPEPSDGPAAAIGCTPAPVRQAARQR